MSNDMTGMQNTLRLMMDRVPEDEIEKLFQFSQYQDELFVKIVSAVENVRLDMGWKPNTFYGAMALSGKKLKSWQQANIHKFFLSDIAYIAYKAGLKIQITLTPDFEAPTQTAQDYRAEQHSRRNY